ncbi:extracellular calcium-sensing receptor-like [Lissotriton helveticus]
MWILSNRADHVPNYQCQEGFQLAAIIGDPSSTRSILMARILGLQRYPQSPNVVPYLFTNMMKGGINSRFKNIPQLDTGKQMGECNENAITHDTRHSLDTDTVSFFSTNPFLSDRSQFPSFFRTIPSDDFQSRGLAQLVNYFEWTWVGLLAEDTDYGQQAIQTLQIEVAKSGVCIAFSESILTNVANRNAFHIAQVIKNSAANVIVTFSNEGNLVPIFEELMRQNVSRKVWIASEAWSTSPLLSNKRYSRILTGAIGFAIHSGEMLGFEQYLNEVHPSRSQEDPFIKDFWEEVFNCEWLDQKIQSSLQSNQTQPCTGSEKLDSLQISYNDVKQLRVTYNVYSAVYSIAFALQDMMACKGGEGPFIHRTCANISEFLPWQILHYVKNVHFRNPDGTEVFFDKNGNPPVQYDIVNWQMDAEGELQQVNVGSYGSRSPSLQEFNINSTAVKWVGGSSQIPESLCSPSCLPGFRKAAKEGEAICCFLCIPCSLGEFSNHIDSIECSKCPMNHWPNGNQDGCLPKEMEFLSFQEPLGMGLAIMSIVLCLVPSVILGLFILYKDTPVMKANNRFVSYVLLLALAMCFLCSLPFIGYPSKGKCLVRQTTFGICFALCVSCILAKTIMVIIAFNATKPNSDLRRWFGPQCSYTVIIVCTVNQIVLCAAWLIVSPPFSEHNTYVKPGKIIIECNEGSSIAFWCMLGYLGLLATKSLIVAFLARKLPDSFNEATFITFSMLAFLSVWLSFIPAYLSTHGKYMVAMEVFAILSSSFALVFSIFMPKCYILLLKPEMNTKQYLMGRQSAKKDY